MKEETVKTEIKIKKEKPKTKFITLDNTGFDSIILEILNQEAREHYSDLPYRFK